MDLLGLLNSVILFSTEVLSVDSIVDRDKMGNNRVDVVHLDRGSHIDSEGVDMGKS